MVSSEFRSPHQFLLLLFYKKFGGKESLSQSLENIVEWC